MSERLSYEVVVVGGGPAGLTTALYATRLGHRTAVFEKAGGRHAVVDTVHNLLGVSEDVSGAQLAELGVRQLEEYGADFYPDAVETVREHEETGFVVEAVHGTVATERIVFATGFTDVGPGVPGLERFTGRGLHYCLHCDAYTLGDGRVFVLGRDDHAAEVAMLMLNFTDEVDLLLNGDDPEWSDETETLLEDHPVERVETEVVSVFSEREAGTQTSADERINNAASGNDDAPWLGGLSFAEGTDREYLGGFAVYGKEYDARLADELGCDRADDGAIEVDDSQETSVAGAYAVGDVTHGQNQTPIALGDGARAGIALHKDLRTYPLSIDDVDDVSAEDLDVPAAAADLRARMRRDRTRDVHAGLRDPTSDT